MKHLLLVPCLMFLLVAQVSARTWYVRPDGTGDAPTIQAAVDLAGVRDTLLLASGTFRGAGNHNINTPAANAWLIIMSETDDPDDCIIDCEGHLGPGRYGFHLPSGYPTLRGLTVTNGNSDGGAIICDCGATMENCIFANNSAESKGGALLFYNGDGRATVRNCSFISNWAQGWGGAVYIEGVWNEATFDGCVFRDNHAWWGGAIYCMYHEAQAHIRNSVFYGNSADESGGAVYVNYMLVDITGCTFFANSAPEGSAISEHSGATLVDRCIIAYGEGGCGLYSWEGGDYWPPGLQCLDIYGNERGDWVGSIAGFLGQNGNFSACPSFCNEGLADLHLCDGSPCLPGNHPAGYNCGLIGALGQDCSCGPSRVEPMSWGGIKSLYR